MGLSEVFVVGVFWLRTAYLLSLLASVTHYHLLKGVAPFGTAHCDPGDVKKENF
jgi:hypothetical protein